MIDASDIVLKGKDEQGQNVSKNPLPKHKCTIETITVHEEFEEPTQYIVDEAEIIGITKKLFVLEEEPSKVGNIKEPFIIDLPPFEPVVLEFSEQSSVHNLQEVP